MTSDRPINRNRVRSVTVMLFAALCGGVAAGAYSFTSADSGSTPTGSGSDNSGSSAVVEVAAFTNADAGSCVTWKKGPDGQNTDFLTVDCEKPHRFEVSAREDLGAYPTSEFGRDAKQPNEERQAELTQELCVGPTMRYLNGKLDPHGRFTISPILPPTSSWNEGDRTMLCGVMVIDSDGRSVETKGLAARQDQSRIYPVNSCVANTPAGPKVVDCKEDHHFQITRETNLGRVFEGEAWPDEKRQNDALNRICTDAALDYMGGDDELYNSTLTPFWTIMPVESWDAGSRRVNCSLISADGAEFNTLKGDVRGEFTVNGKEPKTPPKRQPLRDQAAGRAGAGAAPGTAGAAAAEAQ